MSDMPDELFVMSIRRNPHGYNHFICSDAQLPNDVSYTLSSIVQSKLEAAEQLFGVLSNAYYDLYHFDRINTGKFMNDAEYAINIYKKANNK